MPCSKREWLRRESNDREFSSMAPPRGQIELCSRHRRLEEPPACLWIRQNHSFRQVPPSPSIHNFSVRPASLNNGDYSQDHGSAQYFHCIATDAHIGNASPFQRRPDMHFAWATTLNALPNHHLLIIFCDAVLDHPTGSAPCRRSRGRVFTTVKKHSSSSFKPAFASLGTKKVEKVRAGVPQKLSCLNVTEF